MPRRKPLPLRKFLERFSIEEACREYLVQVLWNGKPKCPRCKGHNKIYEYKSRPIYCCGKCNRQFRVTTGTIFENSKIKLTDWFLAIRLMLGNSKGVSSIQLAKELKITQKSAWYLEHHIRIMMGNSDWSGLLSGVIEVDETYIGGRVRGGKRGRGTSKAKVFGMLERDGELRIMTVKKVDSWTLHPIIYNNIEIGSFIMSDEWGAYNGLEDDYGHAVINHGKRHYADGDVHVNSLEGAWGLLKRSLKSIYHRPSKKYMDLYLAEFEFKYNSRKNVIQVTFRNALKQSKIRTSHKGIRSETGAL